jgi:hypothetical protein
VAAEKASASVGTMFEDSFALFLRYTEKGNETEAYLWMAIIGKQVVGAREAEMSRDFVGLYL